MAYVKKCEKCNSENMVEKRMDTVMNLRRFGVFLRCKCLDCSHSNLSYEHPDYKPKVKWKHCECGEITDKAFCNQKCRDRFLKK